jgi:hypothetical protein
MPAGDRDALFLGRALELPPADIDYLIEEHSEYLGLHMRNTKYMAAEVAFCLMSPEWTARLWAGRREHRVLL